MNEVFIHRSEGKGTVKKGWLTTHHHFSFTDFEDPGRLAFGTLKVLDENTLLAGKGFDMHQHENVEIITLPLEGALEHRDTMGYGSVIRHHDVQVMSAGTGIYHAEYNHSSTREVKYLQLWIQSRERNIQPRYEQLTLLPETCHNRFQLIVSPRADDGNLWINQNCFISIGQFDKGRHIHYSLYDNSNGLYVYIVEGKVNATDVDLGKGDGAGFSGISSMKFRFTDQTKLLLLEVPLR